MAGTLFIEELRRQKRELAHQLQEVQHELATYKGQLAELASEKKRREEEAAQWRSTAARSDKALKFANEDMRVLKAEVDFKLPFTVLQGRLDLFKQLQRGYQFDYCAEIADLERNLDEVAKHQADDGLPSEDEHGEEVIVTMAARDNGNYHEQLIVVGDQVATSENQPIE